MSNEGMMDIHQKLDKATSEYLNRKRDLETAAAKLNRCESVVDEILNRIRREITEGTRGGRPTFGSRGRLGAKPVEPTEVESRLEVRGKCKTNSRLAPHDTRKYNHGIRAKGLD